MGIVRGLVTIGAAAAAGYALTLVPPTTEGSTASENVIRGTVHCGEDPKSFPRTPGTIAVKDGKALVAAVIFEGNSSYPRSEGRNNFNVVNSEDGTLFRRINVRDKKPHTQTEIPYTLVPREGDALIACGPRRESLR